MGLGLRASELAKISDEEMRNGPECTKNLKAMLISTPLCSPKNPV